MVFFIFCLLGIFLMVAALGDLFYEVRFYLKAFHIRGYIVGYTKDANNAKLLEMLNGEEQPNISSDSEAIHYPIVEFEFDGQRRRAVSPVGALKTDTIGKEVSVNVNQLDYRDVHVQTGKKIATDLITLAGGLIFTLLGYFAAMNFH